MKSIIRFFAKEHLFGNLITVIILLFGFISLNSIRRDIWPKVDMHTTVINTFLGGASPEQVEKLIVNPIEEKLKEVDGIKRVFSTAVENIGVTVVEIDKDAKDPKETNEDIQQVLDTIDTLPEDAKDPLVQKINSGVIPVIEVMVTGDSYSDIQLRDTAKFVRDELSLLKPVAKIDKLGYYDKEYIVKASAEKLASKGVSLSQLIQSISSTNISLPGGSVEGRNRLEVLVKTESQYDNTEEIEDTVIISNASGYNTTIKDVATVKLELAKPERLRRHNGKPAVKLVLSKKEKADAIELTNMVKAKIKKLQDKVPEGIELTYANDFSNYLKMRLKTLSTSFILGLLLVLIILTFFLPFRVALVVASGIPIALFSAIVVIYVYGYSLNMLSLIGFIIVLGMLVDDAIVVSENIWRNMEERGGEDIESAVVKGANEVFGPVIASVLTTTFAFGPMLFMTGIFGAFIFEIPLMVIIALAFSVIEVFIIMPSHFASWISPAYIKKQAAKKNPNSFFKRLNEKYAHVIRWTLKVRYAWAGVAAVILIGTAFMLKQSGKFVLFPPEGLEVFFVQVEAPVGTTFDSMVKIIEPLEKEFKTYLRDDELSSISTDIGIIQQDSFDPLTRRGDHFANIRILLTSPVNRDRDAQEIIKEMKGGIKLPASLKRLDYEVQKQGPPQGRAISINIKGREFETIRKITNELKLKIAEVDGVKDIRDSYLPGKTEWQVIPRLKDMASLNLSSSQVAQSVRAAFEGILSSSVRKLDEEYKVRVQLENNKELDVIDQLKNVKIGNSFGRLIPLDSIADFKSDSTISTIAHEKFQRLINVSADVDLEKITATAAMGKIRPALEEIMTKYPDYNYDTGGEDKDTQESMQSLLRAFIIAIGLIYAMLVMTFRSLLQPALILTSIPLGFIGVTWAMLIHNRPFSFMAMLGTVALAGVIVNNSIVFTDFANSMRKAGKDLNDSIVEAAKIRLRPIILTSLTTVCGLLPTAYGEGLQKLTGFGGGDAFIVPIALALGWGLAIGSIMTALFFPCFLRILDDFIGLVSRTKKSL